MKLHEMKQKRNTIASDMRALHEKIGDTARLTSSAPNGRQLKLSLTGWMSELLVKKSSVAGSKLH
ncbi:hypothetical protein [Klebsiella quasipneumoniae]|uniref:hypothetical protein n=1 Tax=Klebsiella quasipneumoniae TaxID=1463165 RepID=UPI001D11ABD6|nr:hypothetical protein [Klebsiella quasipneumoniae]